MGLWDEKKMMRREWRKIYNSETGTRALKVVKVGIMVGLEESDGGRFGDFHDQKSIRN